MGATWHTKCMFDVDCAEDSFADILNQHGIETHATDNSPKDHQDNVAQAVDAIKQHNIDYVMGYSYGCITALDISKKIPIKGLLFLDPVAPIQINKQMNPERTIIKKSDVDTALTTYNVTATPEMRQAYLSALGDSDTFEVPSYPIKTQKFSSFFNMDVSLHHPNIKLFLTGQSDLKTRTWIPDSTTMYPDSTHWILIEPGRYKLATDIANSLP